MPASTDKKAGMATATSSTAVVAAAERDTLEKTVAFLQKREGIDKACVVCCVALSQAAIPP